MNLIFEQDLAFLEERKDRNDSGFYNCLPFPFPRGEERFPGFERGNYVIVTANQKVGKSKFVDYVFVYKSLDLILEDKKIKPHILYFSLEESPQKKRISLYNYLFYAIDNMIVDNKIIKSTTKGISAPSWVFDKLKSEPYQRYIDAFLDNVEFPTDQYTGFCISSKEEIYEAALRYAEQHGHYNKVKKKVWNPTMRCFIEEEVVDENNPFTWDDDTLMPMVILDNYANLAIPNNSTIYKEIEECSKNFIKLSKMGFLVIAVQHQAQEKESLVRRQNNDVVPSAEGLDKNKSTSKDLTLLCGLMSPFKYEMKEFMGYDIQKWRDNIRFFFIKEDRDNGAINLCEPLLFIGESSVFKEMPEYTDKAGLERLYEDLLKLKEEYKRNFYGNRGKLLLSTMVNKRKIPKFAHIFINLKEWLQL